MGYIKGENRMQAILFPESIDEYIGEDNSVRVIEEYVEQLDLKELNFKKAVCSFTGRPPYNRKDLLKLYLYGYLNRIRSSRRLEHKATRNIEVIWLLKKLKPDFKTIADFRKDNKKALKLVFKEFSKLCDEKPTAQEIEKRVQELKNRKIKYEGYQEELDKNEKNEISTTDPDERLICNNNNNVDVSYNVQTTVDAKHKLIADFKVTQKPNDLGELDNMALRAKKLFGGKDFEVLADKGYYKAVDLKKCVENGITPYVTKQIYSNGTGDKDFYSDNFHYDKEKKIKASLVTNTGIMKPAKIVNVKYVALKAKKAERYAAMSIRIF